jgi:predicted TIM-barrel fold metal-dependent hydrolase
MDRYTVISSDCHAGAPAPVYRQYLDPAYREEYDRWLAAIERFVNSYPVPTAPGRVTREEGLNVTLFHMPPEREKEYVEAVRERRGDLGNWDPDIRIRELDREGIAGEVMFCDGTQFNHAPFGVGFFRGKEPTSAELRAAGCRAHNRWLAEFCRTNPHRHAGVALVPLSKDDDVEVAVEEIRWARANGLFGGIMLPVLQLPTTGPESFWHHPRYEPIWQVCEELDMPVNSHITTVGVEHGGSPLIVTFEKLFCVYRTFWTLLWGGVLERHPRLKLCFTEAGGLQALIFNPYFDEYLSKNRWPEWVAKATSMKPSEYWFRQCYVGASAHTSRVEIDNRYKIGVKNIMWGSDYPHAEGTWPHSFERTQTLFDGIPEDEVRMMIGGNAAKVYGFDMEKLGRIAATIGPKVSDFQKSATAAA